MALLHRRTRGVLHHSDRGRENLPAQLAMSSGDLGTLAILATLLWLWVRKQSTTQATSRTEAERSLRSEARVEVDKGFDLRRELAELQDFVRLVAPVLGREQLLRAPIAMLPDTIGPRIEYVKQVVRLAVARCGMRMPDVKVRFHVHGEDHAGAIHIDSDGSWAIDISPRYENDLESLATIVAHEVSHIALNRAAVRLEPTERNERLTDAMAVLAGFGPVFLRTVLVETIVNHPDKVELNWNRIGYLPPKGLAFLSALKVELAGGDANFYREHVAEWQRPAVELYATLRDEWVSVLPARGGHEVRCFACRTAFRLPFATSSVRIKCPMCTFSYVAQLKARD